MVCSPVASRGPRCLCVSQYAFWYMLSTRLVRMGGSHKCVRGTRLLPEALGASFRVCRRGWGRGHSSSIWEVRKKDNQLPPQGPWGYESKAVLGGW